ncbi:MULTISPECIES: hypothetical protein [unclassified Bradyrhizobium]|uniref:hypothetical protein n=1 Tax=unclassified Bradyrhizobium TaxID=2631580 RepID=UPI0024E0DAF7|nr:MULTISPECIES: hypothetical protein [unclassified Bradyrhizobium]
MRSENQLSGAGRFAVEIDMKAVRSTATVPDGRFAVLDQPMQPEGIFDLCF